MNIKGTTIIFFPEFIKSKFGEVAFAKWLDTLSPEAKNVYNSVILPSNWYPMNEILTEPTKSICSLFYEGSLRGAEELGEYSADYALHGIYKFFVKMGSPEFIIKKAGSILPTYYEPCKMEVGELSDGHAILRITEFPEANDYIEARIKGWSQRALAIAGGKNLTIAIAKSLAHGDASTDYNINWE